jgi:hypothetical protein
MSFITVLTLLVALAGMHLSDAAGDYIETEFFKVGMSAKAIYTAPGDQATTINLEDVNGGVVLHMNYRFHWGGNPSTGKPWEDILILNTKPSNGGWGAEQHVNDFYFTPGTKMMICAKAEEGHFAISVNGKQVATYDHRLPVDSVKRIKFSTSGDSVLELLAVAFN